MCKSLVFAALYKVSIISGKESFTNAKKVLNFIQSLINERKVIKYLMAFHSTLSLIFILTNPFQCYFSLSQWCVCVCVSVCVCVCVCVCMFCLFTPFGSILSAQGLVASLKVPFLKKIVFLI